MIQTVDHVHYGWLDTLFINISVADQEERNLHDEFIIFFQTNLCHKSTSIIMVLMQPDWRIFNFVQLQTLLLCGHNRVAITYLKDTVALHKTRLDTIVTTVDKMHDMMHLECEYYLSKQQLAFLMLNFPGLLDQLTQGCKEEIDIHKVELAFLTLVSKYPSIKTIISKSLG